MLAASMAKSTNLVAQVAEVAEVAEVLEANGLFEWLRVQTLSLVPCRRVTRCEVLPGRFFAGHKANQGDTLESCGING